MKKRAQSSPLPGTLAIVDTETTGTSPLFGRIIEIGILRVENGSVTRTFHSLVNPERSLPPAITSITGISSDDLEAAPVFSSIASDVLAMLEGATFVAHNATFDYGFLKSEFRRLRRPFRANCLCTVKLSRALFPEYPRHDLSSIIERFNLSCPQRHRALDDARAVFDFLAIAAKREGPQRIKDAIGSITAGSIPAEIDRSVIDALPESPGVYLFHGPDGKLLYVGKSKNIRRRVISHFSSAHTTSKEMRLCEQVRHVEARCTAGELGALLLESRLIKDLQPLYNRVARLKRRLVVLRRGVSPHGYATPVITRPETIAPADIPEILTIFKHMKQAKDYLADLSNTYNLCQKLNGVEQTDGCCFHYHLHRCKGACVGEENPEEYNARFEEAFAERRVKAWPFSGGIMIEEKSEYGGEAFLVDHWCLLSTARYADDGSEDVVPGADFFDYDSYKILLRFLSSSANRRKIRLVPRGEVARLTGREVECIA